MKSKIYLNTAKSIFLLMYLFLFSEAIAQIKVKKGIIYNDSQAIGKVEGTCGGFKPTDLKFLSMEGTPIISIREKTYSLKNPLFKDYMWFNIRFEDSGKEMKIKSESRCGNEKCIIGRLEKNAGIQFNGSPVTGQDIIIEKYDYSKTLEADTLAKLHEEQLLIEKLKGGLVDRNKRSEVVLMKLQDSGIAQNTKAEYLIKQDNKVIGRLSKATYTDPPYSDRIEYKIFKRLSDTTTEDVFAAQATVKIGHIELFTFVDKKEHSFTLSPNVATSDKAVVAYLVENGYL